MNKQKYISCLIRIPGFTFQIKKKTNIKKRKTTRKREDEQKDKGKEKQKKSWKIETSQRKRVQKTIIQI